MQPTNQPTTTTATTATQTTITNKKGNKTPDVTIIENKI